MTATDDRLAAIDAAPDAPESLRMRVAQALASSDGWEWTDEALDTYGLRELFLIDADIAIAVVRTPVQS